MNQLGTKIHSGPRGLSSSPGGLDSRFSVPAPWGSARSGEQQLRRRRTRQPQRMWLQGLCRSSCVSLCFLPCSRPPGPQLDSPPQSSSPRRGRDRSNLILVFLLPFLFSTASDWHHRGRLRGRKEDNWLFEFSLTRKRPRIFFPRIGYGSELSSAGETHCFQ